MFNDLISGNVPCGNNSLNRQVSWKLCGNSYSHCSLGGFSFQFLKLITIPDMCISDGPLPAAIIMGSVFTGLIHYTIHAFIHITDHAHKLHT